MTRVADTSALYALFSEEDAFHPRAVDQVGDVDPIVVPSEILVETIDLIAYRFTFEAARQALAYLLHLPHVSVADRVEVGPVQTVFDEARGSLSLADAFVVQTCAALGADALAYDEDLLTEVRRRARPKRRRGSAREGRTGG